MQKLKLILKYLSYKFNSMTKYDVHPPFLFDLITQVFENETKYQDYNKVENLKKELLKDNRTVEIKDLGAGSAVSTSNRRTVSQITRYSSKSTKHGRLLYRLVNYFKPETVLELGTSLGLSSAYMALANSNSKIITVEGCPNVSAIAADNFKKLSINNIELLTGNFDEVLPEVIQSVKKLDLVFIDGNHREDPTKQYFEQCLTKATNETIFVFDDIHWSDGMENAWHYVQNHNSVSLTIDIFYMGFAFVRKELTKQHFTIRF